MFVKKWMRVIVISVFWVTLTACEKEESSQVNEQERPVKKQEAVDTKKEEVPSDTTKEETPKEPEQVGIEVNIYSGNENADGFVSTTVTIPSLDAGQIAKQLMDKGVMPADVTVLSLKEGEAAGNKVLDLDLSSTFLSYLQGRGSAGEYITMGSISNTYLEAYGASKIKITVEGAPFETGHTEYNRYMSKFSFE